MYGSVSPKGTSVIFALLIMLTGMCAASVLVDAGAGLGRPLVHAVLLGVHLAWGFELDTNRVKQANGFFKMYFTTTLGNRLGETKCPVITHIAAGLFTKLLSPARCCGSLLSGPTLANDCAGQCAEISGRRPGHFHPPLHILAGLESSRPHGFGQASQC